MAKEKSNGSTFLANFIKTAALIFAITAAVLTVIASQIKSQEKTKYSIEKLDTSVKTKGKEVTTAIRVEQQGYRRENERQHKDMCDYVKVRTTDRWRKKKR